jgi:hypothetical protein
VLGSGFSFAGEETSKATVAGCSSSLLSGNRPIGSFSNGCGRGGSPLDAALEYRTGKRMAAPQLKIDLGVIVSALGHSR